MKIYAVIDLVYGEEGNPGVKLFWSEANAIAAEQQMLTENEGDEDYIVARNECYLAAPNLTDMPLQLYDCDTKSRTDAGKTTLAEFIKVNEDGVDGPEVLEIIQSLLSTGKARVAGGVGSFFELEVAP